MTIPTNSPATSQLGRETAYPEHYDAGLLFPIPRHLARAELGVDAHALPFIGHDRWHAYELSWLDVRGKPQIATATFRMAADSPCLIESKSFKLYLNSLNHLREDSPEALRDRIEADLSRAAGAPVHMQFGLPPMADACPPGDDLPVLLLDTLAIDVDDYGPPNADHLACRHGQEVEQVLVSHLLKSNCPVTGQPDWASVHLHYQGPEIDPAGLLRYLISFRNHREFHEQCVERIFCEVLAHCRPHKLSVEARYTRRGGLDINPWRATAGFSPPPALRDNRQ